MFDIIKIADVKVNLVDGFKILQTLDDVVNNKSSKHFSYINAHAINLAQKYEWFKVFLNSSFITYADGQGIRLASWLLRLPIPPVVNLTRWAWDLLGHCEKKGYSIYILGATDSVLNKSVINIKNKFPKLNIAGAHHGYFAKQGKESDDVVEEINSVSPNVLIVGMGMPTQEKWIEENSHKLSVSAIFNAGSCIDIIAGVKKVCPDWLSNIGFEWFFRLTQEPRRLFARYIFGNPKFIYYIITKRKRKNESIS